MTTTSTPIDRRTALRTLAVGAVVGASGCLSDMRQGSDPGTGSADEDWPSGGPFQAVGVDGTTLVVELAAETAVEQVNLIKPNGELWGARGVAAGAEQVSFAFRGAYTPGEYDVVGVDGEETLAETSLEIRPELEIQEVGLYRNHPDKPWEEVYGESSSDSNFLINGEAFVTVENTGTGPERINELTFTGDVPNPLENPRGSGIHEKDNVVVPVGDTVDVFSGSFPFGSVSEGGVGCSPDGNSGEFTVTLETAVKASAVVQTFQVQYTGSTQIDDCEITISEE